MELGKGGTEENCRRELLKATEENYRENSAKVSWEKIHRRDLQK